MSPEWTLLINVLSSITALIALFLNKYVSSHCEFPVKSGFLIESSASIVFLTILSSVNESIQALAKLILCVVSNVGTILAKAAN